MQTLTGYVFPQQRLVISEIQVQRPNKALFYSFLTEPYVCVDIGCSLLQARSCLIFYFENSASCWLIVVFTSFYSDFFFFNYAEFGKSFFFFLVQSKI